MAQKIVTLKLSLTEARHVITALEGEQADHERRLGRRNPALSRVQAKTAKEIALTESDKLEPVEAPATADAPEEAGEAE